VFLSDPKLEAINAYGLANAKALPHPAVFLLNKADVLTNSKVKWMYASQDYRKRPDGEQLKQKVIEFFGHN